MDEKYCYPNTNILKNKFDITDLNTLNNLERGITAINQLEIVKQPAVKNFNFNYLKKVHKVLFEDLYKWAGKPRTVTIAKGNVFCLPQFIEGMAKDIFLNLGQDKYLQGLNKNEFIDKMAFYMGEINALHPFREGNGRTQRIFFVKLSEAAGYELNFNRVDKDILLAADIDAMNGRYQKLVCVLKDITEIYRAPISKEKVLKNEKAIDYNSLLDSRDKYEIKDVSIKKIAKVSRKDTQDKVEKQDFER